jgi:hypothetical protein
MSNRAEQPFRFACPECGEAIIIVLNHNILSELHNAKEVKHERGFDGTYPFIDLHIDFPVTFDKYVMGQTPFMKAIGRIGYENYKLHNHRLDTLNVFYKKTEDLKRVVRLYKKTIPNVFSKICKRAFKETVESHKQIDLDLALYNVLAKVFSPFSMPDDSADAVKLYIEITVKLNKERKDEFELFLNEIIKSEFLKKLQHNCLDIYPQMLKSEMAFRPALFLDFDNNYRKKKELVAFRVSVDEFNQYKDIYKDISEILSKQIVLVAGVNNLLHRGNHDHFKDIGKNTPRNLSGFADIPYGLKTNYLDDCWYSINEGAIDNQLRNAIAHVKIEYEDTTQIITYYPKKEGINGKKKETIYFLDFIRKILLAYREMHRMHHLIKCLINYYHIVDSRRNDDR